MSLLSMPRLQGKHDFHRPFLRFSKAALSDIFGVPLSPHYFKICALTTRPDLPFSSLLHLNVCLAALGQYLDQE